MSSYVKQLNAAIAIRAQAHRDEEARAAAQAARERLTPLEVRLARVLATIPVEVQREGLSLPALQTALRGRWRGACHPGELGRAMRVLGFQRERQWRSDAGFQARWFPRLGPPA